MFAFNTKEKLRQHCVDHVLSPTEAHSWHEVFEGRFEFLADGNENRDRCFALRKQWCQTDQGNGPCPDLAEAYLQAGLNGHERSAQTGWRCIVGNLTASVDTSGVFTVVRSDSKSIDAPLVALTIYLPGHCHEPIAAGTGENDPNARVSSGKQQKQRAYSAMRSRGRTDNHAELGRREKRSSKRTQGERIYYNAFRKSIKALKKKQTSSNKHDTVILALKKELPLGSQLTLKAWTDLRLKEGVTQ